MKSFRVVRRGRARCSIFPWIALFLPLLLLGCADENYPQSEWRKRNVGWVNTDVPEVDASVDMSIRPGDASPDAKVPPADGGTDVSRADTSPPLGSACASPVGAAESLAARLAVTSSSAPKATRPFFVNDLFSLFRANCGGCHVEGSSGGFHVGPLDFSEKVDKLTIDRILSVNAPLTMPPLAAGGKLASQRTPGDPVLELAALLQLWIDAGRPRDVFDIKNAPGNAVNPFVLSTEAGDNLTNLGSCVPAKRIVATDPARLDELDKLFAGLKKTAPGAGSLAERIGLPDRLDQTDLSTFDTEALARQGVIAFAPAYPLWSDGSGKLRHVRVPRGKSIRFDAQTQSFEIPANTRFYKTFLKKIVDVDGVVSYRKIETRLIVARPDINRSDGTAEVTALFGAYAWNEDETEATLVTDPLRDGEPFRDRLITYVTDEPLAEYVRSQKPNNLTLALERVNAIRRYAIPGRDRCIQCHMGSPMSNFVLGFLPVQIQRRKLGDSGVIEPTGPDELSQLQRLVDYGVITGLASTTEVLPLEALEGDRKPRNQNELIAQGYMLGNCAHCHNPRGFPSMSAPVLADLLNFLPSPKGGIFQFPLERTSPRIFRGLSSEVAIPYITPTIMDVTPTATGRPKWDFVQFVESSSERQFAYAIVAPWRSLIYRNVDTPFTYADDNALFPHMPMHVAGYDCRAPRILGDWMVSIPAIWKDRKTYDFAARTYVESVAINVPPEARPDFSTQPYAEAKPGDADYEAALADAKHRLDLFHAGRMENFNGQIYKRYESCPDTSDIVDRDVLRNPVRRPVPVDEQIIDTSTSPPTLKMPTDGVPNRPHWVITDLTEVPGEWNPRRSDWKTILVDQVFPPLRSEDFASPTEYNEALKKQAKEKRVVTLLQSVGLGGIEPYASQPMPFGLWKKKDGCNFVGVPTVGSFPAAERPAWMQSATDDTTPVYTQLPGEAIYNMVCVNCHGTSFDSLGRQSDNLMLMTGGNARVANFRNGLFGPANAAGTNRPRVYGPFAPPGVSADDMGARYMAWMALGGTAQTIPPAILSIVSNTDVLGERRRWSLPPSSANMLDTAKTLCSAVLGVAEAEMKLDVQRLGTSPSPVGKLGFVTTNGDVDLWPKLCSINNPPPVRAVYAVISDTGTISAWKARIASDFYPAEKYPSDAPVVDHQGRLVTGVTPENLVPWCIRQRKSDKDKTALDKALDANRLPDGSKMPYCPASLVAPSDNVPEDENHLLQLNDELDMSNYWATRGAINAGLAVFRFLQAATGDKPVVIDGKPYTPKPRYDRCDLLAP